LSYENISNTRGNDLEHSNNEKDWKIRSQAPKCAKQAYWRRFRDYNGMGLKELAILNDNLRYNPPCIEIYGILRAYSN